MNNTINVKLNQVKINKNTVKVGVLAIPSFLTGFINTDTEYIEHSDKEKGEDSRRVFGQYQNVFLSVSQFAQLQADFPTDYERTIEKLSQYIETHGKRYANHFALIQKWIAEDRAQPPNGKPAYDYEYQYEKGECL